MDSSMHAYVRAHVAAQCRSNARTYDAFLWPTMEETNAKEYKLNEVAKQRHYTTTALQ